MAGFIHDVLKHLKEQSVAFSQLTFIVPSKRAGIFLKHELSALTTKTIFAPEILSIEEFVEELSQLNQITNTELLFEFYDVYKNNTPEPETEPFENFAKWAQMLIQDFNEIDRYLVDQSKLFGYLSAIKDIDHWSLDKEQTSLIKTYLSFWKRLPFLYEELVSRLINKGVAYQGLMYREAVENLENYMQSNPDKQHIFIGFNRLNTSESVIFQELLHSGLADIFWDIDTVFMSDKKHDAGLFIRHIKSVGLISITTNFTG